MIVGRIVVVVAIANEPNEKVSVYSFVMVEGHQVKIIKTENRRHQEN
jgi:hypothetical protein